MSTNLFVTQVISVFPARVESHVAYFVKVENKYQRFCVTLQANHDKSLGTDRLLAVAERSHQVAENDSHPCRCSLGDSKCMLTARPTKCRLIYS